MKYVTDKGSRAIRVLKYAKHLLPETFVKTFYNSIVEPHFQHCCSVWGLCNSTDVLQLQRLQNGAVRIVTNSHYDAPSNPLLESLGWKIIEQLINRQINLTVFYDSLALLLISQRYFYQKAVNAVSSL